jgi:microcompartment protein CcmL/EutN
MMEHDVIGVLEFNSIAAGIESMDAMVKEAAVKIVDAKTICPGKFYIIVTGEVAAVDASLSAGRSTGRGYLIDELFIPNLDRQILPAIVGAAACSRWDAIGVIEAFSVVSGIVSGDLAAKEAEVIIPEIRLSTGMGGKSFVKIVGEIQEVEAAVAAAVAYVKKNGLLCKQVIIPRPHEDIMPYFL